MSYLDIPKPPLRAEVDRLRGELAPLKRDHAIMEDRCRRQAKELAKLRAVVEAAYRKPCQHPGCQNHVTHPCEGCGRQWNALDALEVPE